MKDKVSKLIDAVFTRTREVTKTCHHNGKTIVETKRYKGSELVYESEETYYNNLFEDEN